MMVREARLDWLRKEAKKLDPSLPRLELQRQLQKLAREKYQVGLTAARDYASLVLLLELKERPTKKK